MTELAVYLHLVFGNHWIYMVALALGMASGAFYIGISEYVNNGLLGKNLKGIDAPEVKFIAMCMLFLIFASMAIAFSVLATIAGFMIVLIADYMENNKERCKEDETYAG